MLDVVECEGDIVLLEQTVQVAEVVCGFIVTIGCHEVFVRIESSFTRSAVISLCRCIIGFGGFPCLSCVLQGDGAQQIYLCLGTLHDFLFCDG